MRFELTTPTLARLCSTPELRPHPWVNGAEAPSEGRSYRRAPLRKQGGAGGLFSRQTRLRRGLQNPGDAANEIIHRHKPNDREHPAVSRVVPVVAHQEQVSLRHDIFACFIEFGRPRSITT